MKGSESSVPYRVGLVNYLTNTVPIINSSPELLFRTVQIKKTFHNQERQRRADMAKRELLLLVPQVH